MTDATPSPETPKRSRTPLWVRLLLFVSLAFNLAVIGIVSGAMFGRDDRPARISRELGLGPYLWALESDRRQSLQSAARDRRDEVNSSRREWRHAYAESLQALRADPFDAMLFRNSVARQAELASRGRDMGLDILLAEVSDMTPGERRAFADELERRMRLFGRNADRNKGQPAKPPHPPRN